MQILQQPRGIMHELRRMNRPEHPARYLPAFRRIVGQMQHDLFHVYTVDQHILMVMRNLRRFTMPEHAHEYPLCCQLIADFERHWLLYVAALFHDIAKGRGGDHSELGARDARRFCREHGLDRPRTPSWSSSWSAAPDDVVGGAEAGPDRSRRDPRHSPERGRHERRLTALYLLTVADIRGTSPKVWNAWKGKLLEDLFHLTPRAAGRRRSPIAHRLLAQRKEEALRICASCGCATTAADALWRAARYRLLPAPRSQRDRLAYAASVLAR